MLGRMTARTADKSAVDRMRGRTEGTAVRTRVVLARISEIANKKKCAMGSEASRVKDLATTTRMIRPEPGCGGCTKGSKEVAAS